MSDSDSIEGLKKNFKAVHLWETLPLNKLLMVKEHLLLRYKVTEHIPAALQAQIEYVSDLIKETR